MKISIYMKTPDAVDNAVHDALDMKYDAVDGIIVNTNDPRESMEYQEDKESISNLCKKWFEWGECVKLELDTDAGTMTVVER